MERTDNLNTSLIENKNQFLLDVLQEKDTIDNIICVDVICNDAFNLVSCGLTNVLDYIKDNRYVFIRKWHD
jgi:hypothetical protein